ncbi:NAD(P)-dependent alcohol dehydrogenase [Nocardia carnea]|uniref:NAD(P)-dependent alcohol dehydrogenase n=1 Tax=Nocardia carnea TaxID=37328 RepID=UPI0024554C44|nr:NAD(P)-dependent alcohol dehydrogenase [Nocardia carnea]
MNGTMTAAVCTRYGGPEVVEISNNHPIPEIGSGDLLVEVHATTVNRTDCAYRAARPLFMRLLTGLRTPRHSVWGTEFAGRVVATGSEVSEFAVDDRVFGYCEGKFGAHAQYIAVAADSGVARIPAGVTYPVAAAATEGAHYALSFVERAQLADAERVLVNGATGGIGSAAVQILKSSGVEVTAVCGGDHLDLVRGLGADRVIDYTTTDFTESAGDYDAVLDAVGKSTFRRCRPLLRPGGIYASSELGPWCQNLFLALWTRRRSGPKVVFPAPLEGRGIVLRIAGLLENGQFRPVIDRHYPLDRIAEAYRYVETGTKIGNVVIDVAAGGPRGTS